MSNSSLFRNIFVGRGNLVAISVLAGLFVFPERAQSAAARSVRLQEKQCMSLDQNQIQRLPDRFRRYLNFVRRCPVALPGKKPTLFVLAVWVNDYYSTKSATAVTEDIPNPIILTPDDREVGTLPAPFPGALPLTTRVAFSDWKKNWPHRVSMTARTEAVGSPPKFAPLNWNAEKASFQ